MGEGEFECVRESRYGRIYERESTRKGKEEEEEEEEEGGETKNLSIEQERVQGQKGTDF